MIHTSGLTKRYGRITAVDGVALDVAEGDRYGLLGPNGSGKTTLLRMLLGLVYPTRGRIELLGRPMPRGAAEVLPQVGALVEGPAGYPHLSGRTNLALLDASGPGGPRRTRRHRIEDSLERVGLGGIDRRPLRAYSTGMRQRLGLAAALLRAPRLLVLDEPTNGLDPAGSQEVRALLAELNAAGTTIVLSSHLLAEVEQLCTKIGIMDRGRLVLQDALAALHAPTGRLIVETPDADAAAALLDGQVEARDGSRLVVRHGAPAELNAALVTAGVRVVELCPERRTLEQIVLERTGSGSDRVPRVPGASRQPGTPAPPGTLDASGQPTTPAAPGTPGASGRPGIPAAPGTPGAPSGPGASP